MSTSLVHFHFYHKLMLVTILSVSIYCIFIFHVGCDLKQELHMVKAKVYTEFVAKKETHLYDPNAFREFCISAGATKLFDSILCSVTTSRHSSDRIDLNKKGLFHLYITCVWWPIAAIGFFQVVYSVNENKKKSKMKLKRNIELNQFKRKKNINKFKVKVKVKVNEK